MCRKSVCAAGTRTNVEYELKIASVSEINFNVRTNTQNDRCALKDHDNCVLVLVSASIFSSIHKPVSRKKKSNWTHNVNVYRGIGYSFMVYIDALFIFRPKHLFCLFDEHDILFGFFFRSLVWSDEMYNRSTNRSSRNSTDHTHMIRVQCERMEDNSKESGLNKVILEMTSVA